MRVCCNSCCDIRSALETQPAAAEQHSQIFRGPLLCLCWDWPFRPDPSGMKSNSSTVCIVAPRPAVLAFADRVDAAPRTYPDSENRSQSGSASSAAVRPPSMRTPRHHTAFPQSSASGHDTAPAEVVPLRVRHKLRPLLVRSRGCRGSRARKRHRRPYTCRRSSGGRSPAGPNDRRTPVVAPGQRAGNHGEQTDRGKARNGPDSCCHHPRDACRHAKPARTPAAMGNQSPMTIRFEKGKQRASRMLSRRIRHPFLRLSLDWDHHFQTTFEARYRPRRLASLGF